MRKRTKSIFSKIKRFKKEKVKNKGGQMIRNQRNKKYLKIVLAIVIFTIILFILGIMLLKYNVEGETNMPFRISKIAIISSSEGIDQEEPNSKWAFNINQSNDIFLYLDQNEAYGKTEAIKSIKIDNIKTEGNKKDNINIYKPESQEEKKIFKNKEENKIQTIEYLADMQSNLKQLKISNQGGIIAFRCSLDNLATYTSNEEQISHSELLKKANINPEDLKIKLTFDLNLKLESKKEYKATIILDLPIENVVQEGTTSTEITELKNIIFKRQNP